MKILPETLFEVLLVQFLHSGQMISKFLLDPVRKGGDAVLSPLARRHIHAPSLKVESLDSKVNAFHPPKPTPAEQLGHEQVSAAHLPENTSHLVLGHDDRRAAMPLGTHGLDFTFQGQIQDMCVQEDQGVQRIAKNRAR